VTAEDASESKGATTDKTPREKLKLIAVERVGGNPRGTAQVLGMALQEGPRDHVKVVDVAMNSPAFDAGVTKGDEIVAFQGFRGETYRKWIDGIQRLTSDTAPGLKIPVLVDREGQRMTMRIEVPVKPIRPSTPRTLAQPGGSLISPGAGPALPASGAPGAVANGGNNVVIDNNGPFGEFFGGQAVSANERAVAQIVRIGGQPSPSPGPAQAPTTGATATPNKGSARIGMAGFRDDPAGMVVMVDVGALPPGNYTVGITDPSVLGGPTVTGVGAVNPNVQSPSQVAPPQVPAPAAGSGGGAIPKSAVPAPGGAGQPQGSLPPASNKNISARILAQVSDAAGPAGAPATSAAPVDATSPKAAPQATGESNVNSAPRPQGAATAGQNSTTAGAGSGTLNQIGTITIDQSGTGRMQQKVEGVQVRNVVGQAIVLYSQGGAPQTTLPANLNGSTAGATRQGVVDSATARNPQGTTDANGGQGSPAAQTAALQPATAGAQVPVAGGIIQLVNDRRPPPTASQAPAGAAVEQPANATPPAGQNLVR